LDAYDTNGNDNTPVNGSQLAPGDSQTHNFCNPLAADYLNDEDWITFDAQMGQHYSIDAYPKSDQTAVVLRLYDSDGTTLIMEVEPVVLVGFYVGGSLTGMVSLSSVNIWMKRDWKQYHTMLLQGISIFFPKKK
jgi:hypothetical protein